MAIIPLKQSVTVTKKGTGNEWDGYTAGTSVTYSARVEETTEVVTNQVGEEAVANLKIYLDKLADVGYDDTIDYQNELGVAVSREPIKVKVLRDFGGKALFTVVYL